jgi:hypothetical protein
MDEATKLIVTILGSGGFVFLANVIGQWLSRQLRSANVHLIGAKTKGADASASETDAKTSEILSNIARKQVENYYQFFVVPLQADLKLERDRIDKMQTEIVIIRDALKAVLTNIAPGNPELIIEMAKIINDLDRLGG